MSHCRDHVEELMLNRLTKKLPDDLFVHDADYERVMRGCNIVMGRILHETSVPSFTKEDIKSFAYLKVHQMMRRGQLREENYQGQVYRALKNLMSDLVRRQDAAWRRGMDSDPIDHTRGSWDFGRAATLTVSYELIADYYVSEADRV